MIRRIASDIPMQQPQQTGVKTLSLVPAASIEKTARTKFFSISHNYLLNVLKCCGLILLTILTSRESYFRRNQTEIS